MKDMRLLLIYAMICILITTNSLAEVEFFSPHPEEPQPTVDFYAENDLIGLKSIDGEIILPAQFEYVKYWLCDGNDYMAPPSEVEYLYAITKKDGLYGVIRSDGYVVSEPYWDDIMEPPCEFHFRVKKDGLWGVINPEGDIYIDLMYLNWDFDYEFLF